MESTKIHENYAYYAIKEIGNENSNIDTYARLIQQEYQRLINNEITLEEFEINTPKINDETELNYIRDRIIEWYPN